jgi:hypothetical protein
MIKSFLIKNNRLVTSVLLVVFILVSFSITSKDLNAQSNSVFKAVSQSDAAGCTALGGTGANFQNFADCIKDLATKSFVPYIFALTLLAFMVAIFWYVRNANNEAQRGEAIKWIIWSVVGFFFMLSFWTFAKFFGDFFGAQEGVIPQFR